MDIAKLIFERIEEDPTNAEACNDLIDWCIAEAATKPKKTHYYSAELRKVIAKQLRGKCEGDVEQLFNAYRRSLLFDAPDSFDAYLLYLEIDRPPAERFYQPRRKRLKEVVDALQALTDDELDELFISMPPRVGKSTILLFYVTWLIGRNDERSNLYSAYSSTITQAFYNGILEVLTDPVTYRWADVFPNEQIAKTNAQETTIDLGRKKRYASLTCRSLYGTLNGACDCNGVVISDDLIGGIEEALNRDRLISAWSKVDNNLLPRAKETAKVLWCGTRWSMIDPAGLRMELLMNSDQYKKRRFKIINIPALDENDESNFHYDYDVGFSTEYYRQRRASFERNNDMASWAAQYMGEPIEREGTVFNPEDMRYYNGELPEGEPDRVFLACDPSFGGGDYCAAPVCYQYGEDIYVHDVVYDNGDKRITQPLLARAIIDNNVRTAQFEATKATETYRDGVQELLKQKGYRISITTKAAPTRTTNGVSAMKEQRILDKAPEIRERMIFREEGKRTKAYSLFMQNVFSFKFLGKNKHDDAPDSLVMAMNMVTSRRQRADIFQRPF